VVAVVAVIILGIGLWMWRQDRRLTRMEQRLNNPTDQKP
jgi:CcmD family protein